MKPTALALAAFLTACSSQGPRPPTLGGCESTEGTCTPPILSGGGSTGDGGSATGASSSGCGSDPSASQCSQCVNASCCSPLGQCPPDSPCGNLLSCEEGCAFASCLPSCQTTFAAGAPAFATLESCIAIKCPVCSESGVGDPCGPGANACVEGLSCTDGGCTKPCAHSTDCAGIGPSGGNVVTGAPNACIVPRSGGAQCTPGCTTTTDCASYANTYCFATTSIEQTSVSVCVPIPDGGP